MTVYHVMPHDKSFPDFKQEAHWDCTGEFLLKSRNCYNKFSFDLNDIDQCTNACLQHNTPFYAFISQILTFVKFPDFS